MNSTLDFICAQFQEDYKLMKKASEDEKKHTANVVFCIILVAVIFFLFFLESFRHSCALRESKLIYPVTRRPVIPFSQEGLQEFKGTQCRDNPIPEARIYCSDDYFDIRKIFGKRKTAIEKVDSLLRIVFDLEKSNFGILPENARIVSIKNDGFKHGKDSHDFEPIEGRAPNSYNCWQMFGSDRIQVTYYVEDEVSYVAGFCIYIQNPWLNGIKFRKEVVTECMSYRKYDGRYPTENTSMNSVELVDLAPSTSPRTQIQENAQLTVKFCSEVQRNVMSSVQSGIVVHQEWDKYENQMRNEECEACTKQLNDELPPDYSTLNMV